MAERTGQVVAVQQPEGRGPVKIDVLLDGKDKPNKITAWKTFKAADGEVDNNRASEVSVGDYGTFTGVEKEESWEDKKFTRFYANDFTAKTPPSSNGSSSPSAAPSRATGTPRSSLEITATEVLKEATTIVTHLVDMGSVKDAKEVAALWLNLFDDGLTAIQQRVEQSA